MLNVQYFQSDGYGGEVKHKRYDTAYQSYWMAIWNITNYQNISLKLFRIGLITKANIFTFTVKRIYSNFAFDFSDSKLNEHPVTRLFNRLKHSKYFQKFADTRLVQSVIEKVSNTRLQLTIEIKYLAGRLSLNIPPPPTDRLWYVSEAGSLSVVGGGREMRGRKKEKDEGRGKGRRKRSEREREKETGEGREEDRDRERECVCVCRRVGEGQITLGKERKG